MSDPEMTPRPAGPVESAAVRPLADANRGDAGVSPVAISAEPKAATDWWAEIRGIVWLILAVLAFHSLIAKPFYIPSPSMMPTLLTGDRLIVTKYPYGWSYVSPSFHVLPFIHGRLFGSVPDRGDVVILKPPESNSDYIKRVIALPGDTIAVRDGAVILNGKPLSRVAVSPALLPIDRNLPCDGMLVAFRTVVAGKPVCALPRFRETLPNGASYDTLDLGVGASQGDQFGPITVPPDSVFVMGDNRDQSADSRYPTQELGLGGPVPLENIGGRAEIITFSYDGSTDYLNPVSWFTALRGGRAGTSLRPAHSGR